MSFVIRRGQPADYHRANVKDAGEWEKCEKMGVGMTTFLFFYFILFYFIYFWHCIALKALKYYVVILIETRVTVVP